VVRRRVPAAFPRRYNEEKRRRNSADFSDQEHEAIRLLIGEDGAPTELARIVSARYREIMVDEYQDTNEVQNRIFDAISCKGENLFTVGDVKQSIYRFRLADPRIFLQHYNTWPPLEDAEEHDSAKLLLSRNFRSRKEVLDATNFIFCNILSEEMGELDYGADEMLRLGANYVESSACGAEFHLLDLPTQTGEQRVRASEAEAAFVADYPFKADGTEREWRFSMTDPIMECNQGSFLLKISKDGRGTAVKISEPCADSISIQTMTTMLMGYKRPDYLAKIGRIHAGGETIDMLEDAIEQQPPYISDYF